MSTPFAHRLECVPVRCERLAEESLHRPRVEVDSLVELGQVFAGYGDRILEHQPMNAFGAGGRRQRSFVSVVRAIGRQEPAGVERSGQGMMHVDVVGQLGEDRRQRSARRPALQEHADTAVSPSALLCTRCSSMSLPSPANVCSLETWKWNCCSSYSTPPSRSTLRPSVSISMVCPLLKICPVDRS